MSNGMPQGIRTALGWTLGVGIIAFVLLIMAIIFGNLSGNVGFGQTSSGFINESITFTDGGSIPATAQDRVAGTLANTIVTNASGGEIVPANNYTVSGVTITALATSLFNGTSVNVSATVSYDEQGKVDTDGIISNYTKSATNTSSQFPTVGTIIGVAILLVILIALLIFAIKSMMGVSGTANSSNVSSGNSFGGSPRGFS